MEKFSKWEKEEDTQQYDDDKILYENDVLKVREIEEWSVIEESDSVICIPFLTEENKFIIRQEYVPTYKWVNGREQHLTVLSGTMESGEEPKDTLRRELVEEAGIKLNESYTITFEDPIFFSKGNTARYHYCILSLAKNEYTEVAATTDGSKSELQSKAIKVDAKYIKDLKASDTITELMLMKLKDYLNM